MSIQPSAFKIQHSKFPRYERHRDSGVEWLGEVPAHWEVEKGKWLFTKMERPVRKEDGIVTAFRDGQVTLRSNRRTEGFTNAIKEHGYQGIRKGDLVIHAMDAFAGAIGISDSDGKSTPVYAACVPRIGPRIGNAVQPLFYAYLLRYMANSGYIVTLAKGIRERSTDFRFNDFGGLQLPLPPKPEQDRIVAFLDEKTAQIDALIEKKQRQIALLDELKQIRINRAVTRGIVNAECGMLNEHLSTSETSAFCTHNSKFVPSGIEWIGEIPEHWEVKKLGHLGKVGNGSTPSRSNLSYWDRPDYPWLNSGSVHQGEIRAVEQHVSNLALRECHLPLVKPNSIVIAITGQGKTRGTAALLKIPATINQHLAYVEIQDKSVIPEFAYLSISSQYHQLRAISESGSTKGALTCQGVKEFKITIPPGEEQTAIYKFCRTLQSTTSKAMETEVQQIQSLKTLRSTFIAHAVTGKIKVRESYND